MLHQMLNGGRKALPFTARNGSTVSVMENPPVDEGRRIVVRVGDDEGSIDLRLDERGLRDLRDRIDEVLFAMPAGDVRAADLRLGDRFAGGDSVVTGIGSTSQSALRVEFSSGASVVLPRSQICWVRLPRPPVVERHPEDVGDDPRDAA